MFIACFEFRVKYSLVNNLIKEDFIVTNTGSEEMIFGVGGHPGFNLPTNQGLKKEDYYFKFDPSIDHVRIPLEAPLLDWENRSLVSTNSLFCFGAIKLAYLPVLVAGL